MAGGEEIQCSFKRGRCLLCKLVVQAAAGVVCGDGQALHEQDVAGIEAFIHEHDGDTGFSVSVTNGSLDGGGTTVAWQQRGVDVQAAERWDIQHGAR